MSVSDLITLTSLIDASKCFSMIREWEQVGALMARVAMLEAKLNEPPKTSDNSSVPPSKGPKTNRDGLSKRKGPRQGSLGRKGGGRLLSQDPDQIVSAKAVACQHCHAALGEDDQLLHNRYDKIDLPPVRPVVTRVERYTGRCSCCGGTTLAPVPDGMDEGTPFGPSIVATALYLAESTRREYRRRLDKDLNAIMALAPENRHGERLRKRYGKVRNDLFTFLIHPDVPPPGASLTCFARQGPKLPSPDNNGSERELRPTATYRKVTGGFRSDWGADLFAGIRSVVGTAARNGIDAYKAIRNTLSGNAVLKPG